MPGLFWTSQSFKLAEAREPLSY
ncbi:hypothetical protein AGR4A_Lc10094 [Agrobacterium tumefaciens str. B6]|uniref:Uncharacterized protein n=1 Tax=Agrobacterium tumefaciens str. B6 TaxID=1183423 RepID=A0A822V084_AGRTU|nr:hypothetical protein AGR4A_Lc10094 [Agrobacterium tumefaciens str. B6]